MCTAISFLAKDHYFGRTLDFEHTFGESIAITPTRCELSFRNGLKLSEHHAIIGMALTVDNCPMYFDAVNECGLGMAGLNFSGNACYNKKSEAKTNVASFEFISYILSQCCTTEEAENMISDINITDEPFSTEYAPTGLHWIVSDKHRSITVEQTKNGMNIYHNPVGVLTNNPEFDMQMFNLNNYMSISSSEPRNMFCKNAELKPYSRGMGAIGLPGDLSSVSRFVKVVFVKSNSVCGESEAEAVNQFFHILNSVSQPRGCVKVGDGFEITNYTSCCNTDKGIYYYTTYNNSTVQAVDMFRENLGGNKIITYEVNNKTAFLMQN